MKKLLLEEGLDILYKLEDYFEYDETETGREIGKLINILQDEL